VYYEFYIDIFFLENMIMDLALLLLTGRILKCRIMWRRLLPGSFFGALGACMLILVPTGHVVLIFAFGYVILSFGMVKITFAALQKKTLIKGVMLLYGMAFLSGGIFQTLFSQITLPVIFLGMLSVLFLTLLLKGYQSLKYKTQEVYDVTIALHGRCKRVKGLRDTGNHLKEPVTGKPVSIIGYDSIKELLDKDVKMFYIPYHSIGKSSGILPGMTLDYISIERENGSQKIEHPVIAVSKEAVNYKGSYQIILNPCLVDD